MARIKTDEITKSDVLRYTDDVSDFGFELKVKNTIPSLFHVEHGGSYLDPVTGKYREFDFRLKFHKDRPFKSFWKIALEAKNIRNYSPILVTCLPRDGKESYHEVITSKKYINRVYSGYKHACISKVGHPDFGIYPIEEFVGKSFTQVAKDSNDDFLNTDSDIYEKWSQSINSAYDLVIDSFKYSEIHNFAEWCLSVIIPVCVVPEGRLWAVNYSNSGEKVSEPEKLKHITVYSGAPINYGNYSTYRLSHVHFVTIDNLNKFLSNLIEDQKYFPYERLKINP